MLPLGSLPQHRLPQHKPCPHHVSQTQSRDVFVIWSLRSPTIKAGDPLGSLILGLCPSGGFSTPHPLMLGSWPFIQVVNTFMSCLPPGISSRRSRVVERTSPLPHDNWRRKPVGMGFPSPDYPHRRNLLLEKSEIGWVQSGEACNILVLPQSVPVWTT